MKKVFAILIVFLFVLSVWWTFRFLSQEGEFTLGGYARADVELFQDQTPIYLGYNFSWKGIGSPTLEKIEFIKRDGLILAKDDEEFRIDPFIAETEKIGGLKEETILAEGLDEELEPVNGYKVDDKFNLVLRIEFDGTDPENDISTIRITYQKFGITQYQNFTLDESIFIIE
ncbi:hypothetical protein ACERII_09895 [Evansella sp. AB-rgal1]|uniref:hypothetical protein n=1 Tax=Evansella sp. AB-rgal1 TaxID=3242696 RepID=UPI00359EC7C0